jgi:2,3-bisphosphoglycerate-independent phosphoglycerate mutase
MDSVAQKGITGMVQTVPKGMVPGSDTANLSVFGYDPKVYYTGRAPLEAINMNVPMTSKDVAFRCNIVTYKNQCMHDFSANHIETEFAKIVIDEVDKNLKGNSLQLYPGIAYRHILLWKNYPHDEITYGTPPHDIHDKSLKDFMPKGMGSDIINDFMLNSQKIIEKSIMIKGSSSHFQGRRLCSSFRLHAK